MANLRTALLVVVMLLAAGTARAEALNDQAIRDLYAAQTSISNDGPKMQTWLAERLTEDYAIETTTLTTVDDRPPERTQGTANKQETLADSQRAHAMMTQQNVNNTVQSIRYEDNGRAAQVEVLVSSSGIMDLPMEDGRRVSLRYAAENACRDTLALIANRIKFKRSTCDTKVNFNK